MGVNIWEGTKAERVAMALEGMAESRVQNRVFSLDNTVFAGGTIVEAIGIPVYVDNVAAYTAFGITQTGWYVFGRIAARCGVRVTGETTVTGAAGYIKTIGNDYVDVAVRFGVAAESQAVTVNWGPYTDKVVFKATDLAVRNLDYRTTFYIYDIAPFTTWMYAPTTDATFGKDKKYFFLDNGKYTKAAESAKYALTADETFQSGKTYYTESEGVYTAATVTTGEAVTADTYYELQAVPAIYYEDHYQLTEDETFQDGKTYYTESGGVYSAATVTPGEAVTANTYYEHSYVLTADTAFIENKAYYTLSGTTYSAATVTAGETVPTVYYVHSKVHFEGMTRNVTYRLNEMIDCPIEIVLPVVPDDGYGAWFEIQTRFDGSYSVTLQPTDNTVKIGTANTQGQTAGFNVIDLQYSDIDGLQMWTLLNTHSNIPT